MNTKKTFLLGMLSCLTILFALPATATAELTTHEFSGTLSQSSALFNAGDTYSGSYTFESTAPQTNHPDSTLSLQSAAIAPEFAGTGWTVHINSTLIGDFSVSGAYGNISTGNDIEYTTGSFRDRYIAGLISTDPLPMGLTLNFIQIDLIAYDTTPPTLIESESVNVLPDLNNPSPQLNYGGRFFILNPPSGCSQCQLTVESLGRSADKFTNSAGPSDGIVITGSEPAGGGGVNKILGWQFTVNEQVTLSALGYRDRTCTATAPVCAEGFAQEHEVAVWDSSATAIATATIPMGTVAPRFGDFRYIPITPVTLHPNETYTLAGFNPSPDDDGASFCANGSLSDLRFDSRINFVTGIYKPFVAAFDYPAGATSYGKPCLGPSLRLEAKSIPYPHGYYPLNGSGNEASGNNINLSPVGSPSYAASMGVELGSALNLNGVDNALVGGVFVPSATGKVSLSAWVYAESSALWGSIVKNWDGQFHFGLDSSNGRLSNYISLDGISGLPGVTSPSILPTQQWLHTAVTVDSTTNQQRLFINGEHVATNTFAGALSNGQCPGLGIGVKPSCDGSQASTNVPGFWHGLLDEVVIWDRALTDREVYEVFRLGEIGIPLLQGNEAPTANAGPDQAIRAGDTVFLDGTQSFDDNTATQDLVFAWNFEATPSGSTATLSDPTSTSPSFTADIAGEYVLSLSVTDDGGLSSQPDNVVVSSNNLAPTANAGADRLVVTGTTIFLDGSASSDPENDSLSYSWAFASKPTGSTAAIMNPATVAASFITDANGIFVVSLDVSDAIGLGTPDIITITSASPEDYTQTVVVEVVDVIVNLPSSDVTTEGNQNALTNFLAQAVAAANAGDIAEAIQKLEKAILRTDGCFLRGSPDTNGKNRDWITNCDEQINVYNSLSSALEALTQSP